ncbi:hypothetical protein [Cupriavidus pauculus]|uniref:hypothetical protein n=1 Tax=Cupriavidus pauculus TaxID=82633 RepID=UPI0012490F93|nr:hypothetical protein [Cupriavidus pauculus]KAB0595502.1 hypothetical protein F7R19_28555 [Cupriavidus pauculus]MCM3608903.1 hypothetical protein [Cupriavidus pauculus]UAL00371.1 hypothetical protein K8O84_03050 [Cupriavidus pauculus]
MKRNLRSGSDNALVKPLTAAQIAATIGIGKFGGFERAEAISAMLRKSQISAIKEELLREPIDDAFTLLVLLGLERARGASIAEKEAMELRSAQSSSAGKKGAEIRHSQPNGAREKAQKVRALWATGKYKSRTQCAEQEHAKLGMSYEAARKALRNTANPKCR